MYLRSNILQDTSPSQHCIFALTATLDQVQYENLVYGEINRLTNFGGFKEKGLTMFHGVVQ